MSNGQGPSSSGSGALVPCVVIVDTRNVRGQSRKVFGHSRQVHAPGIRKALLPYGLDAVDIYAGVATRTSSKATSARLSEAIKQNCFYRDRLIGDGVTVLEGLLVERKGELEEKQVDVLCAVAVAQAADAIIKHATTARCVVVLSEDMDLIPAYEYAVSRGVPVYAGAHDTVHLRPTQSGWLLLDEGAMSQMCSPPGRKIGSELREVLARIALTAAAPPGNWKVIAPNVNGQTLVVNNLGANGTVPWAPGHVRNGRLNLYTIGLEVDPHAGTFPYLRLSDHPSAPTHSADEWDVLYWTDPTSVRVRMVGGTKEASVHATPGTLVPGQRVAVLESWVSGNHATHLIGATSPYAPPAQWQCAPCNRIAQVTSVGPGEKWAEAKMVCHGTTVRLSKKRLAHIAVGNRFRVCLVGEDATSGLLSVMPLSSVLP